MLHQTKAQGEVLKNMDSEMLGDRVALWHETDGTGGARDYEVNRISN